MPSLVLWTFERSCDLLYHCTVFCRIYSNKKKAKWERNIVRFKITVKTMLLIRFFYFYLEYMYTNSPFFNFSPGSIFLRCQLITWQKAYMSNLGALFVYLWWGLIKTSKSRHFWYFSCNDTSYYTYKCSDRGTEVNLPAILGNFDRPTDRPTDDGQTGSSVGFTSNKEREKENEEINPFTLPAQLFHFQYRGPRSLRPAAEFPGSWIEKKDYSPISDFFMKNISITDHLHF